MDTNKMREQFEAWYLQKHCGGIDRVKTCTNAPDTYYYADTQTKWVAWQASREAVVVELPRITGHEYDPLADADYREGCREAIEAQGLKVKP